VLVYLSRFLHHKPFKEMVKEDLIAYLNSLRKSEEEDPLHSLIGPYYNRVLAFTWFFRWLYNPDEPETARKEPQPAEVILIILLFEYQMQCPIKKVDSCYYFYNSSRYHRYRKLLDVKFLDS
jgi:hypothetical protein